MTFKYAKNLYLLIALAFATFLNILKIYNL